MELKSRTLRALSEMICGNFPAEQTVFPYRSSSQLTQFFEDCDTDYTHKGETRNRWVADVLKAILEEPQPNATTPPDTFVRVVRTLMDQADAVNEGPERGDAMAMLNVALAREGFEGFYGPDRRCYLRHVATNTVAMEGPNPHRPFTAAEVKKREDLAAFLDDASEDVLIEEVLMPLFRQLGFHRITASGHRDKALEYGKDIWMKFMLPTQHVIYFGIQAKRDKLDATGDSRGSNKNIAEIYNQVQMMVGHEIFDPETNRRVLIDHAFIVAGGEITKAARNWLGSRLDATRRSQILFMDREDILNLYVVTNLPMPAGALPEPTISDDDIPF